MSTPPPSLQVEVNNRQILKIALPISLALLVPQLNFITNTIFLGHYSSDALAYGGIAGVYYLIFTGIGYGLNNGLQMLISRRAGENRPNEIGKIFNHGVFIALSIAATGILITYFVAPPILKSIIKSQDAYNSIINFLKIRIWGLPFLYIYQMRNALLVGTNQSKYLVAGTLAEAMANLFFDYTLIFGKLGFTEMGFNGAAVASIIAEFMGMFVIFLVIHFKGISRRFSIFQKLHWDKTIARLIASMSGPLVFQQAITVMSWFLFFLLVERNTDLTDQAITNTMRTLFGLFGVMTWAFGSTSNAMVSNVIGQGKKEMVVPLLRKIIVLATGSAIIVCLFLNVFPHLFLSVFGQQNEFTDDAVPVVRIVSIAMIIMALASVYHNSVIGTGNPKMTFVIELIAIILYCVYVFVVLEILKLGIVVGWMSEWIYWLTLFVMSYWYIRSGKWKSIMMNN
jgi:multidrug resistance protein, MATE family